MKTAPKIPMSCRDCPIRHSQICGSVPDDQLDLLAAAKKSEQWFRPQDLILRQGESSDSYFQVIEGWVSIYHHTADGSRQVLDFLVAGDSFGHFTKDAKASVYSVESISPALICAIPHENIVTLIHQHSEVGVSLADFADYYADRAHLKLINASGSSALQRLCQLLIELNDRAAEQIKPQWKRDPMLPLRQIDLADALGLTTVYMNGLLKKLSQVNAISMRRSQLRVLSRRVLTEIRDADPSKAQTMVTAALQSSLARKGA